jgi:hypothetical protein
VAGSIEKRDCGVPGSNDPGVGKSTSGEQNGETSGLLNAVLGTVHAGGEQGWELDHLAAIVVTF